jgi:hypothetical protein
VLAGPGPGMPAVRVPRHGGPIPTGRVPGHGAERWVRDARCGCGCVAHFRPGWGVRWRGSCGHAPRRGSRRSCRHRRWRLLLLLLLLPPPKKIRVVLAHAPVLVRGPVPGSVHQRVSTSCTRFGSWYTVKHELTRSVGGCVLPRPQAEHRSVTTVDLSFFLIQFLFQRPDTYAPVLVTLQSWFHPSSFQSLPSSLRNWCWGGILSHFRTISSNRS